MLARDIKVKTILKQRTFIKNGLSLVHKQKDGDPTYQYAGHLYLENKEYFQNEGLTITKLDSDAILVDTKGLPIWVFTPCDMGVVLTEEEMEEAKKYEWAPVPTEEEVRNATGRALGMLESLFGGVPIPDTEEDEDTTDDEDWED